MAVNKVLSTTSFTIEVESGTNKTGDKVSITIAGVRPGVTEAERAVTKFIVQ